MKKIAYIDNIPFPFQDGDTILTFAKRHLGDDLIPTLCHDPKLKPIGSCRLCQVEVSTKKDGEKTLLASCHNTPQVGQYIYSSSSRIERLRKHLLELILSEHRLECSHCDKGELCEVLPTIKQIGRAHFHYPHLTPKIANAKDSEHPYLRSDMDQCIHCYRCIQACDEIQGQFALSMAGRGIETKVIKGQDQNFSDSECVSCGACVLTCPTNAITDIFQSQEKLADKTTRTICTYCGVGCNLDVSSRGDEILSIRGSKDSEVNQGHACIKGRYAFRFYNHPDRLKSPMIRKNGELKNVDWDEAYDFIIAKIKSIKNQYGADAIAGISSARCTNEENYLMQKLMRAVIGTNNIDGCARVCHAPTALGMQRIFGTGAATNSVEEIAITDCMLIIGANPTCSHPVTGAKIKQAAIKGTPLIVIDPFKSELAKFADYHLQLRPGTNIALLNMMFYYIIKEQLVDTDFINHRCEGLDDFRQDILKHDPDELAKICGVPKKKVLAATQLYAKAKQAMCFHGLGITEHSQGTLAVMLVAQLAMITGNIGKPGSGVNPMRGQNNVQGCADMGVQPHQGAGYLDITDPIIQARYEEFYGSPLSPKVGLTIPEMTDAAGKDKLKALWLVGEDIAQTEPNAKKVKTDLLNLELLIVQDLFMNETAKLATVILPAASFFEKSGTFTNAERRIQRVNQVIRPLTGTKSDGQIIVEIMNLLGYPQKDYHPEIMLKEISQIVPFFAGVTWEGLGDNGKQWPVSSSGQETKVLHQQSFTRGKGLFKSAQFQESKEIDHNKKDYPFILTTVRDLIHYNCGAMTRRTENTQLSNEDIVLINPKDANEKRICDGDRVKICSKRGEIILTANVSDTVKKGILRTTFHFPENMVNFLTSDISDPDTLCPEYKVTAVQIEAYHRTQ